MPDCLAHMEKASGAILTESLKAGAAAEDWKAQNPDWSPPAPPACPR